MGGRDLSVSVTDLFKQGRGLLTNHFAFYPPHSALSSHCRRRSSSCPASTAAQCGGLQRLGPPSDQRDGSSPGQRCYSWSSSLSEAASASYAAHRPSAAHLLIPSAALCAEEGTYSGGIVPDIRQFMVQPVRASDDFTTAF